MEFCDGIYRLPPLLIITSVLPPAFLVTSQLLWQHIYMLSVVCIYVCVCIYACLYPTFMCVLLIYGIPNRKRTPMIFYFFLPLMRSQTLFSTNIVKPENHVYRLRAYREKCQRGLPTPPPPPPPPPRLILPTAILCQLIGCFPWEPADIFEIQANTYDTIPC